MARGKIYFPRFTFGHRDGVPHLRLRLREALPVVLGKMDSAAVQPVIPVADMDKIRAEELRVYLELTPEQFAKMDHATKKMLMESKVEGAQEVPDNPDAKVNTIQWHYLLLPHQWSGYTKPAYIWQPISDIKKYNIIPLIVGSIKTTLVALLFAVPLALGAAIYVSQLANPRAKEFIKPAIEMLAGIPPSSPVFLRSSSWRPCCKKFSVMNRASTPSSRASRLALPLFPSCSRWRKTR